ncbi:hypothetical protein Trydic_g13741 [Trypoxylus dichotomus]
MDRDNCENAVVRLSSEATWIRGHAIILFNEEDRLEKATCSNNDFVQDILLPHSHFSNEIRNKSYKVWQRDYTNVYKNNLTNYYMMREITK